jgi:hypothetical protein
MKTIRGRYDRDGHADLIDMFSAFKADCAKEVRGLAAFLKMHRVCQKLNVSFLLPHYAKEIADAQQQIERIAFLTKLIKTNYASIDRA